MGTVLAAGMVGMPAPVDAQTASQAAATVRFDIAPQPLSSALLRFSNRTGLQLLFDASLARGKSSPGARGTMSREEALSELLAGSGLVYQLSGDTVTITDRFAQGAGVPANGSLVLDVIDVTAGSGEASGPGFQGAPDWVYETPDSVSVISQGALAASTARDTREIFNNVSGVYSGDGMGSMPSVSPNIRGLQDSGRVIVSIDGARQNAQDGGRYGASTTGVFGTAMVSTAFVREVDIAKKTDASANNAGSLGGSVDFRLLKAEDLILPGHDWGVQVDATTGTNSYDFDGSVVGSFRIGEYLSLTLGLSGQEMGQYEPGEDGEAEARYDLTGRTNLATLVKLEGDFGDVTTSLAWLRQDNQYAYDATVDGYGSTFETRVDTVIGDLGWNPESSLVDLKGKLWFTRSVTDEVREERPISPETFIEKELTSFGGILENTSMLDTFAGALTLNYGVEAFRDNGDKSASSTSIAANPLYESTYGAYSPQGIRDVASTFLSAKLDPADWISISGGLRYDWYRLQGKPTYYNRHVETQGANLVAQAVMTEWDYVRDYTPDTYSRLNDICTTGEWGGRVFTEGQRQNVCNNIANYQSRSGEVINGVFYLAGTVYYGTVDIVTYPEHSLDIDRSDSAWLPSATIEIRPFDGVDLFASYSESMRPPSLTEAFMTGAFAPADTIGEAVAPNTHLRPERARTYEIGVNVRGDNLIMDGDRFRAKAVAFHREVDDYIVFGDIVTEEEPDRTYQAFVNLDGTAEMRGVEIEANYDAGAFWLGSSASFLDVEWPQRTEVFSSGTTTSSGEVFAWSNNVPPRRKIVIDAGLRFFDQTLSLGATLTRVTPTLAAYLDNQGNVVEYSKPYTTLDLRGSYKFNDRTTLRMALTNVTDVRYVPATGVFLAPGRTFTMSLTSRF